MQSAKLFAYNFVVVALLACLNCLNRNDYNLPLALLAFLIWNSEYKSQRQRLLWLLLVSIACDMICLLAISIGGWGELVSGNELRPLTQILSVVNFCYKLGIVSYATVTFEDCKNMFSMNAFKR